MATRWQKVHMYPVEQNLMPLVRTLRRHAIPHRITEEAGGQCLWVPEQVDITLLQGVLDRLAAGDVEEFVSEEPKTTVRDWQIRQKLSVALTLLNHFPVTLLTIYFGILGALLIGLDHSFSWVANFTFQPLYVIGDRVAFEGVSEGLRQGQYWRLFTPIFLHFGLLHILFNGLWVWEFGRRLERVFGSAKLIGLILGIGVFSNLCQYFWSGPGLFGGLSGVLYGLMGYLWIYNRLRPHPELQIPNGIIGFMLVWLVLCMTGAVNVFMQGSIANAAHVGGLIAGVLMAILADIGRKGKNG